MLEGKSSKAEDGLGLGTVYDIMVQDWRTQQGEVLGEQTAV